MKIGFALWQFWLFVACLCFGMTSILFHTPKFVIVFCVGIGFLLGLTVWEIDSHIEKFLKQQHKR